MKSIVIFISCLFLSLQLSAQCASNCHPETEGASCCSTDSWTSHRPDGNAPIGVMADHYHHKGGLMVSYRYMNMNMEGNRQGTNTIENMMIFPDYMRAPQDMNMQMHMFGMMYAPGEKITLTAMINYLKNDMTLLAMDGAQHFHNSKGIGDLKVGAITGIWKSGRQSLHLNGGLSIPTGDINQSQHHHADGQHMNMNLPYRMQLGSGTWDVFIGGTYLAQTDKFSFGIQTTETFRTGENENVYRLGNQYQLTSWLGYKLNNWVSLSLRGEGKVVEKPIGMDSSMMAGMSPPADVVNYGGKAINGFVGLNVRVPNGIFNSLVVGLEYGLPVYQNFRGIQMENKNTLNLGLRYSLF